MKYMKQNDQSKCDYVRYTTKSLKFVDVPSTQTFTDVPTKDRFISLKDEYNEIDFEKAHNLALPDDYKDADPKSLVNFGPSSLFSGN